MDELQRDLMQERWDLVERFPNQIRSYVPVFTAYTDASFPTTEATDKALRVACRYEVGRYFSALERLRLAVDQRSLDEAYIAYADMSLHLDRYLRVGGLYSYYDSSNVALDINNKNISDSSLVYADPILEPAEVRDLVVMAQGPDKGRTGILLGIYPEPTAGKNECVVKFERYKGMREIRVVPRSWVAKRLGEQSPDDVFFIASSSSGSTVPPATVTTTSTGGGGTNSTRNKRNI